MGRTYVLNPKIKVPAILDLKLFLSRKSLLLAFAIVIAIWLEKFSLEVKFTPKSSTSFTLGSVTPASSNFKSSWMDFFLFVISNHLDFSLDIGNCHVSDHLLILSRVPWKAFPSLSFAVEEYTFKSSAYNFRVEWGIASCVISFMKKMNHPY